MKAISKTAALREASRYTNIYGRGTSWTVTGPYRCSEPAGPGTSHSCDSYTKAVAARAGWTAGVALCLMGRPDLLQALEMDEENLWRNGDNSARARVARVLAAAQPTTAAQLIADYDGNELDRRAANLSTDVDQDWENEATIYTFLDGSRLRVSGQSYTAE